MNTSERLIVAADFEPRKEGGVKNAVNKVVELAGMLKGTGAYIKVNSVLRAYGYDLIRLLHEDGLRVFADLKLIDIPNTMKTDGEYLEEYKPDILTVMCSAGIDGMYEVKKVLPTKTEVLGVTVLTSLNEEECEGIHGCSIRAGVLRFARMAQLSGLKGLILSPKEMEIVQSRFELCFLELNTPGIRPEWISLAKDDQSRVMTPKEAIEKGATRIVVGRPIVRANDPRGAFQRTLEEIEQGLINRSRRSG